VYLEISARAGHQEANRHVYQTARRNNAGVVFNSDAHAPDDLLNELQIKTILEEILDIGPEEIENIRQNSYKIIQRFI
ncbi:MAG: PHP domain-containing protein, partial [Candidatus Omnitrophica bacterium]|nr:PHP domain-containing protein [Candidatus Omnitrophota bacterium]